MLAGADLAADDRNRQGAGFFFREKMNFLVFLGFRKQKEVSGNKKKKVGRANRLRAEARVGKTGREDNKTRTAGFRAYFLEPQSRSEPLAEVLSSTRPSTRTDLLMTHTLLLWKICATLSLLSAKRGRTHGHTESSCQSKKVKAYSAENGT